MLVTAVLQLLVSRGALSASIHSSFHLRVARRTAGAQDSVEDPYDRLADAVEVAATKGENNKVAREAAAREIAKHRMSWWKETQGALLSLVVWTFFAAIFAYYYRGNRPDWDPVVPPDASAIDWSTGVCDCMRGSCTTNSMAVFCPAVLWAETVSDAGLHGFWKAFWLYTAGALVSFLPCASPIDAALATWDRNELREIFGMPPAGCGTLLCDCVCYCCCPPCMMAQESRHMDSVMEKA